LSVRRIKTLMRPLVATGLAAGVAAALVAVAAPGAATAGEISYQVRTLYTTFQDHTDPIYDANPSHNGVGDLIVNTNTGNFRCTGSLLGTGRHVLTAAHCVTNGGGVLDANSATTTFHTSGGNFSYGVNDFTVHDDWQGDIFEGNDIAILTLNAEVDASVQRYDIYRGTDEVGQIVEKAGYGRTGEGATGDTVGSGTKHVGFNFYDALGDVVLGDFLGLTAGTDFVAGAQLHYDFDNFNFDTGVTENDAFGFFEPTLAGGPVYVDTNTNGNLDAGEDVLEAMAAPGDSGGPTFIGDLIAGITSYGIRLTSGGTGPDINGSLDSSFGEFGGDTRVSYYADWIDSIVYVPVAIPEPKGIAIFAAGLAALAWGRRRGAKRALQAAR